MKPTHSNNRRCKYPLPDQNLFRALMADDPEAMEAAIAEGADLNLPDGDGYTPLITAVMNHRSEAVAFLLRCWKIDLELEDGLAGMTAEQYAADYPEESPVRQAFREFHLVRTYHSTPYYSFLTACKKGDSPVVAAGLKVPFIRQRLNRNDLTPWPSMCLNLPLMLAVWSGDTECVRLLLEAGADPDIKSFSQPGYGLTPRQAAKENPVITKLLEEYDGKKG